MISKQDKKNTQASIKLNSQKKSSQNIIPIDKLEKSSNFPSQITSSEQLIKKFQKNTFPLCLPPSNVQAISNNQTIQLNPSTQNTNIEQFSSNIAQYKMIDIQSSAQQIKKESNQLKELVRPITANSYSMILRNLIQSKNNTSKTISLGQIIGLKNKPIKSTFQLARFSSSQQQRASLIQKQYGITLKNIMSAKNSTSKSTGGIMVNKISQLPQKTCILKKEFLYKNNNVQNQLIEEEEKKEKEDQQKDNNNQLIEEEEKKEKEDEQEDNYFKQIQEKNILSNKNEEKSFSFIEQLEALIPKLPPPFFDILSKEVSLKICNFLSIEDLIKFASVSRQSRNLVAMAMKKYDYSENMEEYHKNKSKSEFSAVQCIQQIQKNFDSFLKGKFNLEKEFLLFLRKKNVNQYEIFQTLIAGINYTNNKLNTKIDVISVIKEKGICACFSGITVPFIPPSDLKIVVPSSLPLRNSNFEQLIKIIHSYAMFRKTNKVSIQMQKQAVQQTVQFQMRSRFMERKLKLLDTYMKPIQRLRKSSNIYDYLNKNIFQFIIKFLTFKEILALFQCGKIMNQVVKSIIYYNIDNLQNNRKNQLLQLRLLPEFGDGILLAKQFEQFEIDQISYITSQRFSFAPLRQQLKAISYAITSKTLEELDIQFKPDPLIIYNVNINYTVPHPDRLQLINSFLEKYPTLEDFKQKQLEGKKISNYNERDWILLYLAMKGLQKLAQFRSTQINYENDNKAYTQTITPLDNLILKYKRLLGKNEDEHFMIPKLQSKREPINFAGEVLQLFPK